MTTYTPILDRVRAAESLKDKTQFLTYLGNALSAAKKRVSPEEREELSAFAVSELEKVPALLDACENYRAKDEVYGLTDSLMNLMMFLYANPAAVPPARMETVKAVMERYDRERFLECAIDEAFRDRRPDASDMERILCLAAPLKDEFHKGELWAGLIHYKDQVRQMPADAKAVLEKYAVSELHRYADGLREGTIHKDGYGNLEYICDAALYIMPASPLTSELVRLLDCIFVLNDPAVSYYALDTLLEVGAPIADGPIVALAENLEFADLTYHALSRRGMADRFPAEYRDPVYLAKSNMVRWLTYPTELGKAPDAIEFIGQTKKKGEVFHVFRYRSDSDNLDDELKGQWLIGWSGSEGGTFSNFDPLVEFEKKTPEKTVRYIRRKLL